MEAPDPDMELMYHAGRVLQAIERLSWLHGSVKYMVQGIDGDSVMVYWTDGSTQKEDSVSVTCRPGYEKELADKLMEKISSR